MDSTWIIITVMKIHGQCIIIEYIIIETCTNEYDIKR